MIRLNVQVRQDYLSRLMAEKLCNLGVPNNKKWYIGKLYGEDYILYKDEGYGRDTPFTDIIPTYSLADLLKMTPQSVKVSIDGKLFYGDRVLRQEDELWLAYYRLRTKLFVTGTEPEGSIEYNEDYLKACLDTPIDALAALLIQCYLKGILVSSNDNNKDDCKDSE